VTLLKSQKYKLAARMPPTAQVSYNDWWFQNKIHFVSQLLIYTASYRIKLSY